MTLIQMAKGRWSVTASADASTTSHAPPCFSAISRRRRLLPNPLSPSTQTRRTTLSGSSDLGGPLRCTDPGPCSARAQFAAAATTPFSATSPSLAASHVMSMASPANFSTSPPCLTMMSTARV